MVAIFVGIRLGTTSAIHIRVVIVITTAIVTGVMRVADVRPVVAEDDRRTRTVVAELAVEGRARRIRLEVRAVALFSRWHAMVVTGRGVV